jgi:hypothetical protein
VNLQVIDDYTVAITIVQFASYALDSPETISVTIPAAALQCCGEAVTASPSFIVQAPTATALFSGTLLQNVAEDELRSTANYTLSVTLSGRKAIT